MSSTAAPPRAWARLTQAELDEFRQQHAALVEFVRTAAPTWCSRRTAGKAAEPVEIWQRGERGLGDFAFVWQLQADLASASAAAERVIGLVRRLAGGGVSLLSAPAEADVPPALLSLRRVDFGEHFLEPEAPAAPVMPVVQATTLQLPSPPATEAPAAPQPSAATPADPMADIQRAIDAVEAQIAETLGESPISPPLERGDTQPDAWAVADDAERERVARSLRAARVRNFAFEVADRKVVLLVRATPFYARCRLFRLVDRRGPRSRFASFVLHDDGDTCLLYTSSPPIHAFNERRLAHGELRLDAQTAVPYLRFFCEFVHGDEGAFPLIESNDELRWLPSADRSRRRAFGKAFGPARLWRLDPEPAADDAEQGKGKDKRERWGRAIFISQVFVGYGRHVFASALVLHEKGAVAMICDEPMHEDDLAIQPLSYNEEFAFELRVSPLEED